MALKLGGTAKAIADAKKKREEEERKASESKTTYDGMKAAAANAKNLNDYANWSSQSKKDEEKSGVNMTMAGPTNKALTSSQAATAAQANKATEKPKISYTGQKTKSAQDFISDWNAQKKQKNQYALEDFGKKNTQAQTYQAQKKQAEQLREAGRALDEDAKNPNRPAVRVAKTAQDVARDIASGKVKIGKQEQTEGYKPLTAEEAAARTLDREQREEDVRRGLVGSTKDKNSALQTWMNDEENGADVWTLMNDMMGDQRVSAATKQAVMQANELLGVDGMKRAMLDNADSRAYMEQVFERDVWNPAQEREKAYNQKYGNPTETLQTAQERMRAHYNAQIDTDKQSLRQIAQTNPLFAAQQYSGMRDSYQQEISDLETMRADMERHPEAYAQWEKDMARDRLLAAKNELASLGDIEKEWQPDYQVKSQAVEGVNDPVYKMINGEADAFQDTEAMAKWRMEQAESLGKREKELQEQLNALAPGDPRRELLQGQIDTLRSQTGLMYEESAMPTLDNLIFSEMMDEGDRLTYNYIYRTEGRNAANEYLDRTKTKWYAGYTDKELQELNDWLQESGWNMALGNLASMVTAPAEAISNLVYTMRTAKGELVDAKDPMFLLTRKSNLTRQATGQALANLPDKNFVGIDKGSPAEQWLNNTRRWILTNGYNLLSSGMDQYGTAWLMVVPGIGQALATGALAGKAGTAAIIETLDEGGFSRQASCRGMVTALCEYGTEKIGMERLVDAFSKGQLNAGFAKTLTKSMLSEALEEVPGNLIDRAMDNWYGGENSHRNQEIKARMKQGMSQAQAEAAVDLEFIQQTATEALMAGLSAGISQGVGYVVGNVSAKHQANREQRQTLNDAARIEREYQQKYGAETAEAVRTLAQEETTEEGRVAALTTAANAVLAEKRGPINPEIAEIILKNDHPDGMKTDELNDWRQTFTNVLNDSQRVRQAEEIRKQRNQGRQQRTGERVEAEKAQAAELNEEETRTAAGETVQPEDTGTTAETPTPRTTPEERRAEAEQLNEQETVRPAAVETPAQEEPTPRTTPAERRAEAERLNEQETVRPAAEETPAQEAPTPRTTPAERRAEAERLNQEETRTAAASEETAPTPRTTPAERRAEAERLNQEETRTAATTEETAPTPRTTPAERRAEAEQLNEQETRQEPVTEADVMEAIQEESEEQDRRGVFAAPATVDGGETQVTGIVTTQHDEKNGAQVEVTDAEGNKKTVKLGDVHFGRAWQRGAYDIATSFRDADAARAFLAVAEQESMPLETVKRDFARYYQYGRNRNENMLNVAGKAISDASARAAYEAGARSLQNDRPTEKNGLMAKVRESVMQLAKDQPWAKVADGQTYSGVSFDASVKPEQMTARQLAHAYVLNETGKKFGVHFSLMNMGQGVAGMYVKGAGTNTVMLNVADVDANLTRAAGHETWHLLNDWAEQNGMADAINGVRDMMFGLMQESGWDVETRIREKQADYKKRAGQDLTEDQAREELMADSLFDLFTREDVLNDLFAKADPEQKTVLQKIADFVKRVIDDMRGMIRQAARVNPEVEAVLNADQEKLNQVYQTVDSFLAARATTEQVKAENRAEEQYMLKDKDGNTEPFAEEQLEKNRYEVANREPVIELNGELYTDLSDEDFTLALYDYFDKLNEKQIISPDFGPVHFSHAGADHLIDQGPTRRRRSLLPAIETVIKEGKVVYVSVDHDGRDYDTGIIAAPIKWNNKDYYMGVVVKQPKNGYNSYHFHDAIVIEIQTGQDKKGKLTFANGSDSNQSASAPLSPAIVLGALVDYNSKFGKNENAVKLSLTDVGEDEAGEAERHFGITYNADVAGYLTTNGNMLDFSGKHWGDTKSTMRQVDHNDIQEVIDQDGSEAMYAFMRAGNIRLMPESGGIDLIKAPAKKQRTALRNYINHFNGEVIVDITSEDGRPLHSFEYSRRTSATKVLADIEQYFEDGTVPDADVTKGGANGIGQFRYSLTDIEDHDSETERLIRENNDLGEALQAANTLIDIMRKRPDGLPAAPSAASIDRLARKIKDETGTKVSLKNLRENLDKTFTVMLNAERSGDVEMAYEMLGDIAADAVNQADVIYDPATAMGYDGDEVRSWLTSLIQGIHESDWSTLSEIVGTSNANEIRKWVKDKTGVWMRSTAKLGENAETGATEWQGSRDHRERRNAHGGIDGDYETFARNFPGIVDPDVNDTEDMIAQVLDALDRLKPQVVNRYESADYNEGHPEGVETAKARITAELFQAYLEDDSFTRAMTGAEATRLSKENRRIIQGMDALKEQLRETEQKVNKAMDKLIGAEKRQARTVEMLKNARKEQERIAQSWREKVADQAHRRAENEEYNKLKNHVVKIKNRLQRMAMDPSNTSRGFIPRELNDVVDRLLRAVDYDGTFIPEGATAPALDAAGRAKMDADLVGQLLEAYQTARTTPENGSYILFDEDLPEVIARLRDSLKTKADGMAAQRGIKGSKDYRLTKAERMTMQEMTDLERIMRGMEAMINNANRALTDAKGRRIEEIGEAALEQVDRYVETHGEKKTGTRITEWLNAGLKNGMMKPVTYFDMMRDTEFNRLFYEGDRSLRNAEGTQVRLMQGAEEKLNELLDKYHMRDSFNRSGAETQKKRREKAVEITLKTGEKLRITDQEAMSIYATYKREKDGVTNHLLTGGIMLADRDRNTTNKPMVLFLDDINAIIDTLTDEQKGFVDEAVGYLSTEVAEWGNEITRQLYGVDKFTEKYYFPFEVVKSTVEAKVAEAQDQRIKVGSQTKALTVGANNALNIRGFTEVWCQHVEKMADYNAFVLPIEDMTRLLNYQHIIRNDDGDIIGRGRNIKTEMEAAYGKESVQYLVRFLSTLNGNAAHEHGNSWLNSFTGKAKAAAVGGNLSVVLQQAGAGVRAMAEINPGYVLKGIGKVNPLRVNRTWEEVQKYAWIAVEKDWGYLDTQQTGNLASRNRTTLMSRINDATGAAAGYMDKLNWTQIWEAVKSEQAAAHKDMDPKSEAFLQLCGQRFTEVIDKTQVIDSVFQRSAWAMEKGRMANFMAFMNEPIAQYNMLLRGAMRMQEAARMPKGEARTKAMQEGAVMLTRNSMAIVVSAMLTSALAAIARGLRDKEDKKYETYTDENGNQKKRIVGRRDLKDKILAQWWPGVLDSLTSLGGVYADIAKGIFTGEEISNDMSMTWVTSAGYLVRNLVKLAQGGTADPERTAYYGMQVVSNLTGVPLSNVYRDVYSIARTAREEFITAGTTEGDAWDISLPMEQRLAAAQNSYVYNKAAKTGEAANRKVNTEIWTALMMTEYKQHGESATFNKIVAAAQKAGASAGTLIGKFKAEFPKISPLVDRAAQALNREDFTTYDKTVKELETRYKLGSKTVNAMVRTAYNDLQEKTPKAKKSFSEELHADQGNTATIGETVAKDALAKALASGTERQIKDAVAQAKKQGRTDSEIKSAVNAAYKQDFIEALAAGNKSKAGQLVKKMVASGAYTEADIASETLNWAKSGSQWGLYDSIRRGDSKQAANIYSWMCQTYGSATMVKSIKSWLETNAADNEENVRKCLKAMGYGAGSIETIIKKSNAKKNKTTTKTKKTNKTKTTKAWE